METPKRPAWDSSYRPLAHDVNMHALETLDRYIAKW